MADSDSEDDALRAVEKHTLVPIDAPMEMPMAMDVVANTVVNPNLLPLSAAVLEPLPYEAAVAAEGDAAGSKLAATSKGRKRKSLPMPEFESDDGDASTRKYKENSHFPWLEVSGPTCHSFKQTESGKDLVKQKRKYRKMRCLDCAAHNTATPWASFWPRKYELQALMDHAQSSHHMKSVVARRKIGLPSGLQPADAEAAAALKAAEAADPALAAANAAAEAVASQEAAAATAAAHASAASDGPFQATLASLAEGEEGEPRVLVRRGPGLPRMMFDERRAVYPEWVHFEGQLCHSERQQADTGLPKGTKKKYRRMQCTLCRDYLPESPWAQVKARKFEAAVMADHERSGHHQKAAKMRADSLGNNDFTPMLEAPHTQTQHQHQSQSQAPMLQSHQLLPHAQVQVQSSSSMMDQAPAFTMDMPMPMPPMPMPMAPMPTIPSMPMPPMPMPPMAMAPAYAQPQAFPMAPMPTIPSMPMPPMPMPPMAMAPAYAQPQAFPMAPMPTIP
eukprot:CAMPEP_0173237382 /NCGR_PEP_ID=MMETSP1142-20121109/12022_1 /TAXON_ID=483371 /ORGANISM="non described non described, Strain CCMP2298" /LENGTH=504 /DNA_ID=CAMNT_0014168071 /DNA_START=141 /DNA_END=1651 /DNA_ORIENTATION=-